MYPGSDVISQGWIQDFWKGGAPFCVYVTYHDVFDLDVKVKVFETMFIQFLTLENLYFDIYFMFLSALVQIL